MFNKNSFLYLLWLCYTKMYKLKSLYCINFFLNIFQQYKFQMKKPVPKIYRTVNWSTNNRALINRGNISIGFDLTT
jgi:hypothetical protein